MLTEMNNNNIIETLKNENRELKEEITTLKKKIRLTEEKESINIRRDELKDIDFGQLLSAAVEQDISEHDILKIMTEGSKRVVGDDVEATLYHVRNIGSEELNAILAYEGADSSDLISRDRALYCLIDTQLGRDINSLKEIDRYLTFREGTVLGDTEKYGEGIVSSRKTVEAEHVKYFHYDDYSTPRFKHARRKSNRRESLRVSFPIYHIEEERFDEIEYILLIRDMGKLPFSNHQIRTIRGYANYGTLAIAIKQLIEKDKEILEKDRRIEEQDIYIVSGVRRFLHNIVTPLSTIENIVEYLNEIINVETDQGMSRKYSILLTQVNKVKDSLRSIRDTITATKHYQASEKSPTCSIETHNNRIPVELDDFVQEYVVNIKEAYGSRIDFSLNLNAKGIFVLLEKTKMAFILDNAVRNTFQQCEDREIENTTFEIRTIYNPGNNAVVLFLRDFGGGLSEEQYARYLEGKAIQTTKKGGTGEGIPTILCYFREMGCQDVDLNNFVNQGILYSAAFPVVDA